MKEREAEREGWVHEMESAYLYRAVAESETGSRARLFRELAQSAGRQAREWEEKLRRAGEVPPTFRPSARARLTAALVRRLGPRVTSLALAAMKVRGLSVYSSPEAGPAAHSPDHEGHRHRLLRSGGQLRAAVFGVNDGLVSNACLILGVAGATTDVSLVLLAGAAGLLAGAFSMAAGEYVSVRSQRELYENQIELERAELEAYPEEEAHELALIYRERGMPAAEAERVAARLVADPDHALETLAREELGIAPDRLGSPVAAATSSFVAFSGGAAVPLLPFLAGAGDRALVGAVAASALALLAVGATLSLFTGRSALGSALRMLGIGGAAGTVTHVLGRWLGAAVA